MHSGYPPLHWELALARRPLTLGSVGNQTTARATGNTGAIANGARISGKGIRGDRAAGTSAHGISVASMTPVSTISPLTGRANGLSRIGTKTAVRGASGS